MAIMKNLPSIEYSGYILADISKRISIVKAIKENPALYQEIELQGYESPEHLAQDFYEDPNLYWLVYMMNDVIDPFYGWVLSIGELQNFIIDKYGAGNIYGIHHYEFNGTPVDANYTPAPDSLQATITSLNAINYWRFDETTSTTAVDSQSNLNLTATGFTFADAGINAASTRFDAVGYSYQQGTIGNTLNNSTGITPTGLQGPFQNGSLTFSTGITFEGSTTQVLFGVYNGTTIKTHVYWDASASGDLILVNNSEGNSEELVIANAGQLANQPGFGVKPVLLLWEINTTIGVQKSNVYINDVLISSVDTSALLGAYKWLYNSPTTWDEGFALDHSVNTWVGVRDDLAYWNIALTAAEKTKVYRSWEGEGIPTPGDSAVIPITNSDYEEGINDKKRKIKVVRPNYVTNIKQLVEKAIRS